ncbi:hypothetical protein NDU88_001660 [Pleurodeles waltl]|uniref:Uncharacterized protein n=1 Tax=Pleurodeles waltl TaxID=8319 RepID=A0AAV7T065_PLEWA|nr:hypothetical protein NDU88_001660 [Pleurodeles waltl]
MKISCIKVRNTERELVQTELEPIPDNNNETSAQWEGRGLLAGAPWVLNVCSRAKEEEAATSRGNCGERSHKSRCLPLYFHATLSAGKQPGRQKKRELGSPRLFFEQQQPCTKELQSNDTGLRAH